MTGWPRRVALVAALAAAVLAPARAARAVDSSTERRALAFVATWRDAWRAQDEAAYLALYAADARIDARDRAAFVEHKRKLFARGDAIAVRLGDAVVEEATASGENLVKVTFDQDYESPLVSDFGRKVLLLRPAGSSFLVMRETWAPQAGSIEHPLEVPPPDVPLPPAPTPPAPEEDESLASMPILPPAPSDTSMIPGLPADTGDRHVVDEIVVKVNERVLTRSMFVDRLSWYLDTLLADDPPDIEARLRSLAKETLDTTVDRWLLLEEAKARNADIEGFWREWVANFRKQVGAEDMKQLEQLLHDQGSSIGRLKDQVVETQIPNLFIQQEIARELTFSDEELRSAFERDRARYERPRTVTFRQILVAVPAGEDEARGRAIADKVIDELRQGRDWCEIQQVYGQSGPCGDVADVSMDDLIPELRGVAEGLPLDAVSQPIRSPQGWHVVQMRDRQGLEPVTFEEARDRVLRDVQQAAFDKRLEELLKELRAAAQIDVNERYQEAADRASGVSQVGASP